LIRVILPPYLRTLANLDNEAELTINGEVTIRSIIDGLETHYPMLRGTIRDYATQQRRPFLRFFACKEDFSLEHLDTKLPQKIANGEEPFLIVGAIAGG